MNQSSRSPRLPLFVTNEMALPSGETAQPRAWSRSFAGASPSTDTDQTLDVSELHSFHSSVAGYALTRNLALSGNQPVIPHFTCWPFSSSGSATVRVSPVSRSLSCIPRVSLYARYLPSGEIAPPITGFSLEFVVSCRNFISGATAIVFGGRFSSNNKDPRTRTIATPRPAAQARGRRFGA